ncbi:MAG: ComEA family DNA-binding protein [Sedimentisphaerales bacterium]|nr:ComEA family DNA-binding protein [Sedimentisphaerales bacterium]
MQRDMGETRQKNIQSFAFVLSVCAAFCFCLGFVSEFAGTGQSCEIELESRINPNYAPIESLVRLPGIGPSRAGAIVAYREKFGDANGGNPVFKSSNDLQKVRGIGPKTVQNIGEWLKFE